MLVNAATLKRTDSTRLSAMACELTSITACVAPASRIMPKRRARSSASGVVCIAGHSIIPKRCATVPRSPGRAPI
jgi:hypothetical protein